MITPEVREELRRLAYARGRAEGVDEGRAAALRTVAINLARAKLDPMTPADEDTLRHLADESLLLQLVNALGLAVTAADARAALDQLIAVARSV